MAKVKCDQCGKIFETGQDDFLTPIGAWCWECKEAERDD